MAFMHRMRRLGIAGGLISLVATLTTTPGGVASAAPLPATTDPQQAIVDNYLKPATTSPPGANRFDCRDKQGRDPVILLHGTAMNQAANLAYLSPMLANAGYCVFSITYGQTSWSGSVGGLGNKDRSARQVGALMDRVLAATGATKVDFVGHSQGGAIAQLVSQLPGKAAHIDTIVGLSAPNRGYSRTSTITDRLPASREPGENDWGPRHAGIRYVNLATTHDQIVTPWQNSLMAPGPNVANLPVQNVCPKSLIGHVGMAYSPMVGALVRNALDPAHPVAVPCVDDDYPA
ncbi:esterase/lipase family protein [Gordonia sp. NPDC003424]